MGHLGFIPRYHSILYCSQLLSCHTYLSYPSYLSYLSYQSMKIPMQLLHSLANDSLQVYI